MKINFKILNSDDEISKNILIALKSQAQKMFQNIASQISTPIKDIVLQALKSEPEYFSLKDGKLRYEMGISDTSSVDTVIEKLVNTLSVTTSPVKISGSKLFGQFSLSMIKSDDFNGIINDPASFVIDQARGYSLPWLQWLLLKGNDIIVQNYSVKIGNSPVSRTGNAIMVKSNRNWRVPTEFVGTEENNWTTRAIFSAESSILLAIENTLRNSL